MQASARTLDQVYDTLTEALQDLDDHGHAMAALHLAMAVDCLKTGIDTASEADERAARLRPRLRLVASS